MKRHFSDQLVTMIQLAHASFLIVLYFHRLPSIDSNSTHCQPIDIPSCQNIPYDASVHQNFSGHERPDDDSSDIGQFYPLVRVNCSSEWALFLRSVYAVACKEIQSQRLNACKRLCRSISDECDTIMRQCDLE